MLTSGAGNEIRQSCQEQDWTTRRRCPLGLVPVSSRPSRLCQAKHQIALFAPDIVKKFGAGNETRTRDPNLGKVVLYQLSYSRRKEVIL